MRHLSHRGAYGRIGGPCLGGCRFGNTAFDKPSHAANSKSRTNGNEDFASPLPDLVRVPVYENIGRIRRQSYRVRDPKKP